MCSVGSLIEMCGYLLKSIHIDYALVCVHKNEFKLTLML